MEKLSKILLVVCVLFIASRYLLDNSKYTLTSIITGQGFFYVNNKFYLKPDSITTIIKLGIFKELRMGKRGLLYDDETLVGFVSR